jgi:hypothetical protein
VKAKISQKLGDMDNRKAGRPGMRRIASGLIAVDREIESSGNCVAMSEPYKAICIPLDEAVAAQERHRVVGGITE